MPQGRLFKNTHKHINTFRRHATVYSYIYCALYEENSPVDVSDWLESWLTVKLDDLDVYVVANAVYAIFIDRARNSVWPQGTFVRHVIRKVWNNHVSAEYTG